MLTTRSKKRGKENRVCLLVCVRILGLGLGQCDLDLGPLVLKGCDSVLALDPETGLGLGLSLEGHGLDYNTGIIVNNKPDIMPEHEELASNIIGVQVFTYIRKLQQKRQFPSRFSKIRITFNKMLTPVVLEFRT